MSGNELTLRDPASQREFDGFGRAVKGTSWFVAPETTSELVDALGRAQREGLTVAFRGAGRSYGDAAINAGGLVVDATRMDRMLAWDPQTGIVEAQAGMTIEGLWRRTIEDGYWPYVVPGTMRPTLGGVLSMNVHGKNNFNVGPFGNYVLDFDLVTARGELLKCSREENGDVFHAAIGGLGLLGAITRVRLKLKKLESGQMRVWGLRTKNLDAMFDCFEEYIPKSDYLVGWVDCLSGSGSLGRGQVHRACYLSRDEDPDGPASFHVEKQGLPSTIMGVPKSVLWRFMRPFVNNPGVRLVNTAKYVMSGLGDRKPYFQSHVGFAFLLDYVPDWRLMYGPTGFIQYQIFVPHATARETMKDVLKISQQHGMPAVLGVLKRHKPDDFLLSHAVDGWSMALDYRVPPGRQDALWKMTEVLTERVLTAGGRFYFAKDAVLRQGDVTRAYGDERIAKFTAIKSRLDPDSVLATDLGRRALGLGAANR